MKMAIVVMGIRLPHHEVFNQLNCHNQSCIYFEN